MSGRTVVTPRLCDHFAARLHDNAVSCQPLADALQNMSHIRQARAYRRGADDRAGGRLSRLSHWNSFRLGGTAVPRLHINHHNARLLRPYVDPARSGEAPGGSRHPCRGECCTARSRAWRGAQGHDLTFLLHPPATALSQDGKACESSGRGIDCCVAHCCGVHYCDPVGSRNPLGVGRHGSWGAPDDALQSCTWLGYSVDN
jgi:hypothetical protein